MVDIGNNMGRERKCRCGAKESTESYYRVRGSKERDLEKG